MVNSADIQVYENSADLVDSAVLEKVAHIFQAGTVFFYAQKKHALEIIPEAVVSFWVMLTLFSVFYMLEPWAWFDDQFIPIFVCAALTFAPWIYFLLEVARWNREYLLLTNFGLYHRYFDFLSADWRNRRVKWAPDSEVNIPISYKLCGLDVGNLEVVTIKGVFRTPSVIAPHRLHGLIAVADQFDYSGSDEGLWGE